ncbi:MAG: M48 family metalloprotease [Actinomycetota bacterium]
MAERFRELVEEAGLRRVPELLWSPVGGGDAIAFGTFRRHQVALGAGLVAAYYAQPATFDAVIRHELAHFRNRDVGITYLANSLWYAFILLAIIPFLLVKVIGDGLTLGVGWRLAVLTALVFVVRNAILRARELYADVRASIWDGPAGRLAEVVTNLGTARRRTGFTLFHPSSSSRAAAMSDPGRLMPLSPWDALSAGLTATISVPVVATLFAALVTGTTSSTFSQAAASILFAPLLGAAVAVGLWRGAFVARAKGERSLSSLRISIPMAAGVILGTWLSPPTGISGGFLIDSPIEGLAVIMTFAALALVSAWLANIADLSLDDASFLSGPRRVYGPGLIAASVVFVWVMSLVNSFWFQAQALGVSGLAQPELSGVGASWGIFASLAGYVALQQTSFFFALLLAGFVFFVVPRRAPSPAAPSWAWLDVPETVPSWARAAPQIRRAVMLGLWGGVIFLFWLVLLRLGFRQQLGSDVRESTSATLALASGMIWLAVSVASGVAFLVATYLGRGAVPLGATAGGVSGLISSLELVVVNRVFGGGLSWDLVEHVFVRVMGWSSFLSLAAACAGSAFAGRVGSSAGQPSRERSKIRAPKALALLLATVVVVPAAIGLVVQRSKVPAAALSLDLQAYLNEVIPLAQTSDSWVENVLQAAAGNEGSFGAAVEAATAEHETLLGQAQKLSPNTPEVKRLNRSFIDLIMKRGRDIANLKDLADPSISAVQEQLADSSRLTNAWVTDVQNLQDDFLGGQ